MRQPARLMRRYAIVFFILKEDRSALILALGTWTDEREDAMREERTSISRATTPQKIGEFWDSHSLSDYWENTHEVSFEVDDRLTEGRPVSVSASRKSTLDKSGASNMDDKFARICWNTAGWRKPTGDAASFETKDTFVSTSR